MTEFIHRRCGGNLVPEVQPRYNLDQGNSHRVVKHGTEVLHRCDRCGRVGQACEPPPTGRT